MNLLLLDRGGPGEGKGQEGSVANFSPWEGGGAIKRNWEEGRGQFQFQTMDAETWVLRTLQSSLRRNVLKGKLQGSSAGSHSLLWSSGSLSWESQGSPKVPFYVYIIYQGKDC